MIEDKLNYFKLSMKKISKTFPGVKALDNVDFEVEGGTVHAIVGENGAGKSTLMKVLSGVYKKDSGEIFIDGLKIEILSPFLAKKLGIAVIYQEFSLIPELDINQNIFLGIEKSKKFKFILDKNKFLIETNKILKMLNLNIRPLTKVKELTVGEQQLVEIAKVLASSAKVIVMDEPTSALSEEEKERLFEIIRMLKSQGIGIIYITHRMKEVFEISDQIMVMRDGARVGNYCTKDVDEKTIIKLMVGRELGNIYKRERNIKKGDIILKVENLTKHNVFKNISFTLREREVLGISGLMGAGRTEIIRCIFGLDRYDSGEIYFMGEKVRFKHTFDAVKKGIGLVPEDRRRLGLVPLLDIKSNITLPSLYWISRMGWVNTKKETSIANEYSKKLNIIMASLSQNVNSLSGGNQQKVVLAKWLARNAKLLILDEPTRGIDVGAKSEIHKLINLLVTENNISIIMISSELLEILGVSDRILVIHEGNLEAELDYTEATEENIIFAASGHKG